MEIMQTHSVNWGTRLLTIVIVIMQIFTYGDKKERNEYDKSLAVDKTKAISPKSLTFGFHKEREVPYLRINLPRFQLV